MKEERERMEGSLRDERKNVRTKVGKQNMKMKRNLESEMKELEKMSISRMKERRGRVERKSG